MALTEKQFENFKAQLQRQRDVLGADEYNSIIDSAQQKATASQEASQRGAVDRVKDFAGGAVYGLSAPGRTLQKGVASGIEAITGIKPEVSTKEGFEQTTGTDLDTTSGKVGEFAGETVPFVVGGGLTGSAVKAAPLASRMLAQGGTAAVVQGLNTGEVGKDEFVAFLAGAGGEVAGTLINQTLQSASTKLPEWLVKPLVKQSAIAKQQGRDITPFLVESGYVGSVDDLITQSSNSGGVLNTQIKEILNTSNKTVNLQQLAKEVAEEFNSAGAATNADEILSVVAKQAFESKGVLANSTDDLAISTANSLRSQLDETLYSGRDYLRNVLPENKTILEAFTDKLRATVQTLEPATQPLFSQYSKEITLRKALKAAASASGGRNSIGLLDLVTSAGAYAYTGDPLTAVAAFGARKVFETPTFKTNAAQVFKNSDKVASLLAKASPAIRGAFASVVSYLSNSGNKQEK